MQKKLRKLNFKQLPPPAPPYTGGVRGGIDIDISDEAGQFKPIAVGNTEPQKHVATQSSATDKSDDEVVTAHIIPDDESEEVSEEEKTAIASAKQSAAQTSPPPRLSATSFEVDSDKPKEKPSDDIGPRPSTA